MCKLCKSSSQLGIYAEDSGFGKISSRADSVARSSSRADSRPTPWPPRPPVLYLSRVIRGRNQRTRSLSPDDSSYRRRCWHAADAASGNSGFVRLPDVSRWPRLQGSPRRAYSRQDRGRGFRQLRLHATQTGRCGFRSRTRFLEPL